MNTIKEFLKGYKKELIVILVFCVMFLGICFSIKTCCQYKHANQNNLKALTDTIHLYKDKFGEVVASKILLEGSLKDLKIVNDSLYKKIKAMNISGEVQSVVYMEGDVELPTHDTTWVIEPGDVEYVYDTINNEIYHNIYFEVSKDFAFNDKWHSLEGNVSVNRDSLSLDISKNLVNFDYTIAVNNKNQVYISSSNPYVQYKEITGLTLPKLKEKKFGIGPYVGYGYNFMGKKFGVEAGIGIQYNLFKF